MIKTIIFDMGGVIIVEPHDSWKEIFSELGPAAGIRPSTLVSNFKKHETRIQIGDMTLLEFYKEVLRSLNRKGIKPKELLEKHIRLYNKVSGKIDTKLLAFIDKLRAKYKVACFTNTETEIAALNKKRGLFKHFDCIFISTKMGMRKPDPKSYKYVINALKVKPDEAIFIDNNKAYVDAAEKLGINGIVYKNIDKLKKDLTSYSMNIR